MTRSIKRKKCMKKSVKKRIILYNKDKWDIPSGGTRDGERAYRKEGCE